MVAQISIILALIRWIHFVAAFTAVGALFTSVMVITPVMKTLQPQVRAQVTVKLLPRMIRVQISAALVLMAAGVALAFAVSGHEINIFLTTRWGLSILAGAILTLVMFFNALVLARPTVNALVKLLLQSSETPPAPGAGPPPEAMKIQGRLNKVIPTNFALALIILFLMGFAAHG